MSSLSPHLFSSPLLFLFCRSCSICRHTARSPGGVGCSSEESGGLRSSPALGGQLFFIQPETQAGPAAAPGRTLHRQVKNGCRPTLSPNKPSHYILAEAVKSATLACFGVIHHKKNNKSTSSSHTYLLLHKS